jgi:hypothetical protein
VPARPRTSAWRVDALDDEIDDTVGVEADHLDHERAIAARSGSDLRSGSYRIHPCHDKRDAQIRQPRVRKELYSCSAGQLRRGGAPVERVRGGDQADADGLQRDEIGQLHELRRCTSAINEPYVRCRSRNCRSRVERLVLDRRMRSALTICLRRSWIWTMARTMAAQRMMAKNETPAWKLGRAYLCAKLSRRHPQSKDNVSTEHSH